MSIIRTPAGAGLIFAATLVAAMLALHVTASPCELPDGTLANNCKSE